MSVQKINYECPVCGRRFGWFEVDKATRRSDRLFCPGCWQMIDIDDLVVYDTNGEAAQTGRTGKQSEITVASTARTSRGIGL